MTDTVLSQIVEIRASGVANMLDVTAVQRAAYDNEFYELVCFIEDDRKAYVSFIFTGETS